MKNFRPKQEISKKKIQTHAQNFEGGGMMCLIFPSPLALGRTSIPMISDHYTGLMIMQSFIFISENWTVPPSRAITS